MFDDKEVVLRYVPFLALIISLITFASNSPARTCFSTVEEWQNQKASLPNLFQEIPIYLTLQAALGSAGIRISSVGSKFKLDAKINKMGFVKDRNDVYAQKICIDGPTILVTFETGAEEKILLSEKGILIEGNIFVKNDEKGFRTIIQNMPKYDNSRSQTGAQ